MPNVSVLLVGTYTEPGAVAAPGPAVSCAVVAVLAPAIGARPRTVAPTAAAAPRLISHPRVACPIVPLPFVSRTPGRQLFQPLDCYRQPPVGAVTKFQG